MDTGQSKLLIRADAGPRVGTGHVIRTLALAKAWKLSGGSVMFVCGQMPRGLTKRIEAENYQLFQIQNDNCDGSDAKDTAEIASVVQPEWIVLDGDRFDDNYQRTVKAAASNLLIIDDFGKATHQHADLILNQNAVGSRRKYSNACRGKVLAGPQFVLLRTELTNGNPDSNESKRIPSEAKRILVSFMGTDPGNWTLKTLQVLSDLNRKRLVVDCIVGVGYEHIAELEMFKKTANMNLRIHQNVDRLSQLMPRTDLAITASGTTCFELAHCGIPAIVTSTDEDHREIARTMSARGAMLSIDENKLSNSPTSKEIVARGARLKKAVQTLLNNPNQRKAMSDLGRRLVDGNGAQRITRMMTAGAFSFRAATRSDIDSLWKWQNDPEARSVALEAQPMTRPTFTATIQRQIESPNTELWIAEDTADQPIGAVRFDMISPHQPPVISIIVDQTRRGRGLGTLMISQACEEFFEAASSDSVVAQIKPGNAASEKAFRAAGFTGIEPTIVNGKMANQVRLERTADAVVGSSGFGAKKSA